jgi:hypothetical protein
MRIEFFVFVVRDNGANAKFAQYAADGGRRWTAKLTELLDDHRRWNNVLMYKLASALFSVARLL